VVSQHSYFQHFYNRTHLATLFYSSYESKIIKQHFQPAAQSKYLCEPV